MSSRAWKLVLEGFGVLLTAALAWAVGYVVWAQGNGVLHRKTVVLEMSWKRGDTRFGPNFVHLESACLSNPEPGCFCSNEFRVTRTKEFADYIESFGSSKVPVKYVVNYDNNGEVVGAILESVGVWQEQRFNHAEWSLSETVRAVPNQSHRGVAYMRSPADCFPQSVK
jgi:hypothetical protein